MTEHYCEKCQKLVPEIEIKPLLKDGIVKFHFISKYENSYRNQSPGTIGCRLEWVTTLCGPVREPTDQEYFIFNLKAYGK